MLKKIHPTVAYIIVSWNNKTLLDECIKSIKLQKYSGKIKIIIVDNNSSDDTVKYVSKKYPTVELLPQFENNGFARGNNIGIDHVMKDKSIQYIVLLNTDARISDNWTETMVSFAQNKPKLATAQSITLDYYDHSTMDSTHIYLSRYSQATQASYGYPIGDNYDVPPVKVFGCNAAAMLISRKFIEAQPFSTFFDETMFMYLEDVDIATRATVMGWDNYTVPGTRAYHMGSVSSSKKDPSFSMYMTFRNNLGLVIKNMPLKILVRLLILTPKTDYSYIKHLRHLGQHKSVRALIKGRFVSLFYVPIYLGKRRILNKHVNIEADYLWRLMERGY